MDSTAEAWLRTVSSKVKAVDPHILVTASTFYFAATGRAHFDGGLNAKPGNTPSAYPLRPAAMMKAGVDILDIHTYPTPARPTLPAFHIRAPHIMLTEGITAAKRYPLPLIAGEFGLADVTQFSHEAALSEMSIIIPTLCEYHFSGYVVWSWISERPDA